MKVLFKKSDAVEPFSFRFTDNDGKVILKSENYKARKSALNGIESVKKNATSEKRYEIKTAKNGKFYFNLKATNGQVIGTSPMFESEADRQSAIALLGSDAASAELDDQSTPVPKAAPKPKPLNAEQLESAVAKKKKLSEAKEKAAEKESTQKSAPKAEVKPKAAPKSKAAEVSTEKEAAKSQLPTEKKELSKAPAATPAKKEVKEKVTPAPKAAKAEPVKKSAAAPAKSSEKKSSDTPGEEDVKSSGEKKTGPIGNLANYIGRAAGVGIFMGTKPMTIFVDTVKVFYKKISH